MQEQDLMGAHKMNYILSILVGGIILSGIFSLICYVSISFYVRKRFPKFWEKIYHFRVNDNFFSWNKKTPKEVVEGGFDSWIFVFNNNYLKDKWLKVLKIVFKITLFLVIILSLFFLTYSISLNFK